LPAGRYFGADFGIVQAVARRAVENKEEYRRIPRGARFRVRRGGFYGILGVWAVEGRNEAAKPIIVDEKQAHQKRERKRDKYRFFHAAAAP